MAQALGRWAGRASLALLLLGVAEGRGRGGGGGGGGGGRGPAPPPPEYFIGDLDQRKMCDPCSELWEERLYDLDYSGIDSRQVPRWDKYQKTPTEGRQKYGQLEPFTGSVFSGDETCEDLGGSNAKFDIPCQNAEKGKLSRENPKIKVYCDATGDGNTYNSVTCDDVVTVNPDQEEEIVWEDRVPQPGEPGAYQVRCTCWLVRA